MSADNASDHVPVQVEIDLPFISVLTLGEEVQQFTNIMKIKWNDCSSTEIDEKYVSPLIADLSEMDFSDSTSTEELIKTLTEAIVHHSTSISPPLKHTNKKSKKSYFKLLNTLSWPGQIIQLHFKTGKTVTLLIQVRFSIITSQLGLFIVQNYDEKDHDKIKRLCDASETNEKLFWKLVKSQRSSPQMSAFLVDRKMITDKTDILNMWADHFETLGTPSDKVR